MYFAVTIVLLYISCVQCANILGVFMFPSISHQIVYQPIWRELSLKGHNVTVVTPDPLNDPTLINLTEISVNFTYEILKQKKNQEIGTKNLNLFQIFDYHFGIIENIAEAEFNSIKFKKLISDQSKFDLILIECIHPVMYALAARFKAPTIGVYSAELPASYYATVGNPTHPILYQDVFLIFQMKELSVWQNVKRVFFDLLIRYYHHNFLIPRAHEIAKKSFGNDIPYVGELERNVSMLFLNVNPIMYTPRPNVPAFVGIGLMHIKPAKPLPQDLQTFLDQAKEGAIYFSLGTNVKTTNISEKIRKTITDALSELPYKVVGKWDSDRFLKKPANVMIRKWLPQQDVLSHPNIKAFVTQGGLQSIEEAISRRIPLIGMPFETDQPMNVRKIIDLKIGLGVDPFTVSKDELKNCIVKVAEDASYKKRIEEVRDLMLDSPMTELEKAIWWSEYVIRHNGVRHLRSPTADIPWFQYLLLDVVAIIFFTTSLVMYMCYKIVHVSIGRII